MAKGSAFEREICRRLSLWWTQDLPEPRDDVFWRTSNSGGRATVRHGKGKRTANQCGDVCAVDPVGAPFLKVFTVEIKRGYNRATLIDLIDKRDGAAKQEWEKWIEQARRSAEQAGTPHWLIVARRDGRQATAVYPFGAREFVAASKEHDRIDLKFGNCDGVCLMSLDAFLYLCDPRFLSRDQ